MNDRFTPLKKADCYHAKALREYKTAHKRWMNTNIFRPAEVRETVTCEKNAVRAKYEAAYLAANPTHILT